jgi:hypothetical protein
MRVKFVLLPGVLRVEIRERETVEETRYGAIPGLHIAIVAGSAELRSAHERWRG